MAALPLAHRKPLLPATERRTPTSPETRAGDVGVRRMGDSPAKSADAADAIDGPRKFAGGAKSAHAGDTWRIVWK